MTDQEIMDILKTHSIGGVRFNVIRRPYSGVGPRDLLKATKKAPAETPAQICVRVGEYIKEDPTKWFYRWNVRVSTQEIIHFRKTCLDPILEQLCDWWTWMSRCHTVGADPFLAAGNMGIHWTAPFGTYNPLEDGGASELDNYIQTGNRIGLQRTDTLFPELEPVTHGIPNALPQRE